MMTKSRVSMEKRAAEVWKFVLNYYTKQSEMPTLLQIGQAHGKTKQWAFLAVRELERMGKIKVEPRKNRGIVLI